MSTQEPTRYYEVVGDDRAAAAHYPDVREAGGLRDALTAAFAAVGSTLRPKDGSASPQRVEREDRFCQIFMAAEERLFLTDFWRAGVCLGQAGCRDLEALVRVIDHWLTSGCSAQDLGAAFDCVKLDERAEVFDRAEETEHRWQAYLTRLPERLAELAAVIEAAADEPRLRQLFPFTALNRLCFSRCTGYPYTRDIPSVLSIEGNRYQVWALRRSWPRLVWWYRWTPWNISLDFVHQVLIGEGTRAKLLAWSSLTCRRAAGLRSPEPQTSSGANGAPCLTG